MNRARMLDLFSGLGGWSTVFAEHGYETTTLDINPKFKATYALDILSVDSLKDLEQTGPFNVIAASPPCEGFSVSQIGRNWEDLGNNNFRPKTEKAELAIKLAEKTFHLIDDYADEMTLWVVENPRGMMRRLVRPPTDTTWYCQWGMRNAKPTDIWTNMNVYEPGSWPKCNNGNPDHDAQSRYRWKRKALGQNGGTQGLKDNEQRALIPYQLAEAFVLYADEHLR